MRLHDILQINELWRPGFWWWLGKYFSQLRAFHHATWSVFFFRKPTTHKGKKVLLSKEPQTIENTKQTFLLKGRKTGGVVNECLKDLVSRKDTIY